MDDKPLRYVTSGRHQYRYLVRGKRAFDTTTKSSLLYELQTLLCTAPSLSVQLPNRPGQSVHLRSITLHGSLRTYTFGCARLVPA